MNFKLTRTRIALVASAAAAAIASVSYAAIPAANGTISACKDSKGALKVIDAEAGQSCASNQQLLAWNQQGPAGPTGETGAQGPQGEVGPTGPVGPAGVSGYQVVHADSPANVTQRTKEVSAYCPAGTRVIAGGHSLTDGLIPDGDYAVSASQPAQLLPGWTVRMTDENPSWLQTSWFVRVYAVCASVS
jgi:hypothetical protein